MHLTMAHLPSPLWVRSGDCCSRCGSLRSRDAVPGQGSSSGSSSGCQEKRACTGEIRLSLLISRARIQLGLFPLGVWSWERAVVRAAPGALAGPQVWGGRGRASAEADAECLNEAAAVPPYPEEFPGVTEGMQRALPLSTAPFQRFPPNPRGFFRGWS